MSRIPESFIDDLLRRVDIVDVVNRRVPLKRSGKEYSACCPFHDEKTPSFTVSEQKQFYHCFGCGAHGSAIRFLMEYDGLGFVDSINELAQLAGVDVPREEGDSNHPSREKASPLYDLLEQANSYYRRQLREHPGAETPVAYLKNRGVSGEIAGRFEVGFAPPGWDNLSKALTEAPAQLLLDAGLTSQSDQGSHYDRLRERITFPIRDSRGRLVGFGGRLLDGDGPKYLNSPETTIFHKGQELYGLYQLQQVQRQPAHIVVVEGYLDVIALAQFGATYAVAALGTALTAEHIRKLYRITQKLVLCFDGDRAGRKAAERSLENLLPHMQEGRQADFLFLPDGDDPDTFIRREGLDGFETQLSGAEPLSEFLFKHLTLDCDLTTLDGKARLAETAQPWIVKIPDGFFKQLIRKELQQRTGVDLPDREPVATQSINRRAPDTAKPPGANASRILRKAFVLLLQEPPLAQQISIETLDRLQIRNDPGFALFCRLARYFQGSPEAAIGLFMDQLDAPQDATALARLLRHPTPPGNAAARAEEFDNLLSDLTGAIHKTRGRIGDHRRQRLNELIAKLTSDGIDEDEKAELRQLQEAHRGQSKRSH